MKWADRLQKCNHMDGFVDGHLPWVRFVYHNNMRENCQTVTRAQMNDIAEAIRGDGHSPWRAWPAVGMYRSASPSLGNGEGWYFMGHDIENKRGPLPNLSSNHTRELHFCWLPDNNTVAFVNLPKWR